jgi:hypothetical protein
MTAPDQQLPKDRLASISFGRESSIQSDLNPELQAGTPSLFVVTLRYLQSRFSASSIGIYFDISGYGIGATYSDYLADRGRYPELNAEKPLIPEELYPTRDSILHSLSVFLGIDRGIINVLTNEVSRDFGNQSEAGGESTTLGSLLANIVDYTRIPTPSQPHSAIKIAESVSGQSIQTVCAYDVTFSSSDDTRSFRIGSGTKPSDTVKKHSYDFYAILVAIKRASGVPPESMIELINLEPSMAGPKTFDLHTPIEIKFAPKTLISLASALSGDPDPLKEFGHSKLLR